jgi:hypothetical protein
MRGGPEMLEQRLLALTALAGQLMVDAAATDEWETAQRGYAELLGGGKVKEIRLAERRLRETREQLIGAAGPGGEEIRAALAIRWAGRLADLLEENPDAEAELQALVEQTQTVLRAGKIPADIDAVSADGEVTIEAAAAPGSEHPGALAVRSELAYSIGKGGDAAAARDQFAALLPLCERVLGPEHAETLAVWYQLAHWTTLAGEAAATPD